MTRLTNDLYPTLFEKLFRSPKKWSEFKMFATFHTSAIALVRAPPKPDRASCVNGLQGSMTSSQQVVDKVVHEHKSGDGHAGREIVVDSQIDNAIATVSEALAPLTGGLSMAVGNTILGPFVQLISDGAEVVLGNLVGGAFHIVADRAVAALTGNLGNLANEEAKYNINPSKLVDITPQFQNTIPKKH